MKKSSPKKRSKDETSEQEPARSSKRRKLEELPVLDKPVKSKKELRMERKAALKAKAEEDAASTNKSPKDSIDKREIGKQKKGESKRGERRAKKEEKEKALENRFQLQDQLKREREEERNQQFSKQKGKGKYKEASGTKKNVGKSNKQEGPNDLAVFKSIFKKQKDATTGATTCRLGVQYIDLKVGTGPIVQPKSLVTVKYQLRGGSPTGILIDSSKKFSFRLGKGEVIQGWDIGLEGMRQGGVRHLIVPPKAGYGPQDIGAGPGAVLHFDVTLSEILR